MKSYDELVEQLKKSKVSGWCDQLTPLIQPAVRLTTHPISEDEQAALGSTRIGGLPDLTAEQEWPCWRGKPMSFLGQVSMAELSPLVQRGLLPNTGLLSFFNDSEQESWGFDPAERDSWMVVYCDLPAEKLERRSHPEDLPDQGRFAECRVSIAQSWTLPDFESPLLLALGMKQEEIFDDYGDFLESIEELEAVTDHHILGHAAPIQGDMMVECQLASNGFYCGDGEVFKDPVARELVEGCLEWQLLAQFDSDDNPGMMWGDCGRVYYYILKDDLLNSRFDKTWRVLQCF